MRKGLTETGSKLVNTYMLLASSCLAQIFFLSECLFDRTCEHVVCYNLFRLRNF